MRGLCPSGWHVPTDGNWTELGVFITTQGFEAEVGSALKSTTGWYDGGNGTDHFEFSARPGGVRRNEGDTNKGFVGLYEDAGFVSFWWSSTTIGGEHLHTRHLWWGSSDFVDVPQDDNSACSVRCMKNSE